LIVCELKDREGRKLEGGREGGKEGRRDGGKIYRYVREGGSAKERVT
jgi:hypothetical protein